MLKNLPHTSHQLSICEANFLRLKKILINFDNDNYEYETVNNDLSHNKVIFKILQKSKHTFCLLYTSPSPRDGLLSRMPSSA